MSRSFVLSSALFALRAIAQTSAPFTDDVSGISFNGFTHASGTRVGFALPEEPTTDFIGQLVAPVNSTGGGYGAISLGGSMRNNLLIVAWPNGDEIVSSFREATGYTSPAVKTGDFSLTTIPEGTFVNETSFSYTFLCSNCIGEDGLLLAETGNNVVGWALSKEAVTDPTSASSALSYHAAGFGLSGVSLDDAKSAQYDTWAALAVTAPGNGTAPGGNTTTPIGGGAGSNSTATISNSTFDYIVAGGGVAGIVAAERLAESGASVLLLERGGPSLAISGNNNTVSWNNSVTMYDIPGNAYHLSTVGNPAFCTDTADQAGCLLGGGSMVNALMFVPPQDVDFDANWPEGWKSSDVAAAASRVYERNPGQTYGSEDGQRYNDEAWEVLSQFFSAQGWAETDAIESPNDKVDAFTRPPWNIIDGLRAGPVRTYLPLANAQSNFKLQLNTEVVRVVRNGSTITGVETKSANGERVIYNVNAGGRVVLSAGALATPRILFNSGIGPAEQLQTVASGTTGVTLPDEADWIDLPVGAELKDHVIFTVKFKTSTYMPALDASAFTSPDQTTIDLFAKNSGLLSQSGQRFNFWTAVNTTGSANSTEGGQVFIQGTCTGPANNTIQMKIYLTHGVTSVGSLGITPSGATELTSEPWMKSEHDIEAITTFMDRLLEMTNKPNSTLTYLSADSSAANVTGADLIKDFSTALHYVGTAKMGVQGEPGVVVDTDTKVYGTDNLFVVDASMHPDLPTGNTQAIVMVAAEAAAARILALGASANETVIEQPTGTGVAQPSGTGIAQPTFSQIPTETPVATSPEVQPTQQPENSYPTRPGRPGRGRPFRGNSRRSYKKRDVEGRVPLKIEYFDDEESALERSQLERASFLDSAY